MLGPFTQRVELVGLTKYGVRAVFDCRGHETGSIQAVWEFGSWDGAGGGGVADATFAAYRSNDGIRKDGTAAFSFTYNSRISTELDLQASNFLIVEMLTVQSSEAYVTLVYNGKNPFGAAQDALSQATGGSGLTTAPPLGPLGEPGPLGFSVSPNVQ